MNPLASRPVGLLAALVLLAGTLCLQARPFPHEAGDLPADPAVRWGTLDNGVRYAILPWSEPPGRLSLRLLVEAGSLHESDRQKGLAHLIEHMAFNGTRNFSAGEMVEYFQRLGMAFGPDTNAHTWWRETVYKLELPNTDAALIRDGLKLLRDYADGMLLEEAEIEREKGVVLSELRDRSSPEFFAYVDGLKFALPDSLISQRVVIGDEDVIRMAARGDLVDFYRRWYTAERMVLVAVGEIDPQALLGLFDEYFGDMEPGPDPLPDPDLGTILPVETRTHVFSHPELAMGEASLYTRRQIGPEPDTFERRRERYAAALANAMLSRRLERLSKEEDSPINSGAAYDFRWLDFVRHSGVHLRFQPRRWQAALRLGVTELNRALQHGFSEAELAEARARMANVLEQEAARAPTRLNRDLADGLVRSVRDGNVFLHPAAARDLFVPVLGEKTLAEAEAALAAAWGQPERMVHMSGNFGTLVADAFEAARSEEVPPPDLSDSRDFAYTDFGPSAGVVERRTIEDLDIHQLALANGVRLNLKRTDYEANRIHVKASFGAGLLEAPADLQGLPLMARSTFIEGGLGEHSHDELKALTAGRTVGLEFGVEEGQFTLGGLTNQGDLEFQLQLLAAYLADPGYRPEGRRLFMRQLDALYTQLAHDPEAVMQNEGARFLAGGDPRFGFPQRADLERRTSEEVAAWLAGPLREGYLELSVVGDFADPDEVVALVSRTFGALPPRAPERPALDEARVIRFPSGAGLQVFPFETTIPRGLATLNWLTTGRTDIGEVRRLSVLGSIFSDRMRVRIREELGEAYSPYAFNSSSETFTGYGVLRAVVGVQPDKAGLVERKLFAIAASLVADGVDADELVRAVEPIKSSVTQFRRTNRYWLNSVLLQSQDQPARLDWARSFIGFWDTVTVAEIDALARRYLQPEAGVPVRVLPRS